MVDSRFQVGVAFFKEVVVFLKVSESGRASPSKGDLDRGVFCAFFSEVGQLFQ